MPSYPITINDTIIELPSCDMVPRVKLSEVSIEELAHTYVTLLTPMIIIDDVNVIDTQLGGTG